MLSSWGARSTLQVMWMGAEGDRPRLRLIGPFALTLPDGTIVSVASKKSKAVLALLALAPGGVHARGWLQTMLWGSRFREQAQTSLRRELTTLCRILDDSGIGHLLKRAASEIALDLDGLEIDVLALGIGLERHPIVSGGEFLEGLWLPDCEEFGDWLVKQRDRVADLQRIRLPAKSSSPGAKEITGGTLPETADLLGAHDLTLPPKPSVCTLPFRSLGAGVESFLGPATAEELSMTLARLPSLFVVASGAGAALVDRSLGHVAIARRLGVRYLIDGAVQQDERQVRIGVSLVDGQTGVQIWTQSFTGHRDNIFDLQERIATAIAPHIHTQIDIRELRGALINPLRSGDAYALYWRANALFRQWDRGAITEAIEICEILVAMQPVSGWSTSMAAFCHALAYASNWTDDPGETQRAAMRHYQAAIRYGGEDPAVLGYAAGTLVCIGGDIEVADRLVSHALTMLPSYQPTLFWGGWVDIARGDAVRARERFELSLRINPMAGVRAYTMTGIGLALILQGDFPQAYALIREAAEHIPDYPLTLVGLAVSAAMVGEREVAQRAARVLAAHGGLERVLATLRNPEHRNMIESSIREAEAVSESI